MEDQEFRILSIEEDGELGGISVYQNQAGVQPLSFNLEINNNITGGNDTVGTLNFNELRSSNDSNSAPETLLVHRIELNTERDSTMQEILPSCGISFLAGITFITMLTIAGYSFYIWKIIPTNCMRISEHPCWDFEVWCIILLAACGILIICYLTQSMFVGRGIYEGTFNGCMFALGMIIILDIVWIIKEQQEGKNWFHLKPETHQITPSPEEKLEATEAHDRIQILLQLKGLEMLLLIVIVTMWIRDWHHYRNAEIWLTRRPHGNECLRAPNLESNSARSLHTVTVNPQDTNPSGDFESSNPGHNDSQPPSGPTFNGDKLSQFQALNEMEINKTARQEFREHGDGNDVGAAVPRISY